MGFTRKTEVKDISSTELSKVAKLLNQSFAWKKLMQIVPKELTDAELLNEGQQKYNSDHIKLIETASLKLNSKSAAQIFLEEWITTGRIRPTLSHLLQLLIKCELFRAADYVAVNLLSEETPQRPERGPAAKVDIDLPYEEEDIDVRERGSGINSANATEIRNLNGPIQSKQIHDKEILLVDTPMSEIERGIFAFNKSFSRNVPIQLDNNIKSHLLRSTTNVAAQIPEKSQFEPSAPTSTLSSTMQDSNIIPNISLLNLEFNNLSNSYPVDHGEDIVVPNLSNGTCNSNLQDNGEDLNVPNLSILHLSDSQISIEQQGFSENIPQFSALMNHSQPSSDRLPEV